jgi:TonB family protein
MNWLSYLLQVNLYLLLFYGFYQLLLHSETFFNLNRGYLIASAALAFFIPLIQSEWVRSWFVTEQVSQTFYTIYDPEIFYIRSSNVAKGNLTLGDILAFIYVTGIIVGMARFGGNLAYLGKLMKSKTSGEQIQRAFSFFNMLFVSKSLKNRSTIMKHEFVHIRQLHSADIMLFELIVIFNWFNPIVYLYKSSIKHIHEFIADEVASRHEASKADYAMLLFQEQFGVQAIPLTNNFFNSSLLKLRINMLKKQRSTRTALLKYGLTAPLFMLMIVVSSATLASKSLAKIENDIAKNTQASVEEINLFPKYEKIQKEILPESDAIDLSKALIISPTLAKDLAKDSIEVFSQVDEQAEFPGGMPAFARYLQDHLKYPEAAQKVNASGKVYIQFIVQQDGNATDFTVLKSAGYGMDEEAIRVLQSIPKWEAGVHQGKKVNSRFVVPIKFEIDDNKPEPIYILDGQEITKKKLELYDPNTIERINVLKDKNALEKYGEKGKNGVVIITSKKK